MKQPLKKAVLIVALCIMPLGMGGCCDTCINRIMTQMRFAIATIQHEVRSCCTGPQEQADACLSRLSVQRGALRLALTTALGQCLEGEKERAEQTIKEFLETLENRIGLTPGTLIANSVIEKRGGGLTNSTRFFMHEEAVTLFAGATTDGQWKTKATAVVNGRVVLPEAAGKQAVQDTESSRLQPVTEILLEGSPNALSFLDYKISDNGTLLFANMSNETMYHFEGEFSVSGYSQGADGTAVAIPGEAEFTIEDERGSIVLRLDSTRPENSVIVGPDGTGVLQAAYATKGTGVYDFVPEVMPEIYLRLPLRVDPATMAITFSPAGASYAGDVMPIASGDGPDGTSTFRLPCVEPDGGHSDARCRCIDTDDDGEPDMLWEAASLRQMLDDVEKELRENCGD